MNTRRNFLRQSMLTGWGLVFLGADRMLAKTTTNTMNQQFDVIIIGGSYAGLAAGMALGRALRRVLIIDAGEPCNRQTPYSHNFLTQDGLPPLEIAHSAREQLKLYQTVQLTDDFVSEAVRTEAGFRLYTRAGRPYEAKKLVFASGIRDLLPSIPGFDACWGISVLHCPYCNGYEVRNQKTGILASGDAAFEIASLISNWTLDLTIYSNGPAFLQPAQRSRLLDHNIGIVETRLARLVHREGRLDQLSFDDGTTVPLNVLYARVPFEQHSKLPQVLGCEITSEGFLKVDAQQRTNIRGIYAAGDNVTRMRTVANAVAMGTAAGMMVNKELIEESF